MKLSAVLACMIFSVGLSQAWAEAQKPTADAKGSTTENPILRPSTLPFEAIPYDQIQSEHLRPALFEGLKMAKERLDLIRANPDEPTFANTIDALERVSEPFDDAAALLDNYLLMQKGEVINKTAEDFKPLMSAFSNSISFDTVLFGRLKKLYDARDSLGLTVEEQTLLRNTYRGFVRNGALLDQNTKTRINEIDNRLSVLGDKYDENATDSMNAFVHFVTDPKEVEGIPENALKTAAKVARAANKEGWGFTLQAPSYNAVVKYAKNRALRELMWRAYYTIATSGKNDNRPLVLEFIKLREERAHLLGYKSHAHFMTEDRMAGSPETVQKFLTRLADVYRPAAQNDVEELRQYAGADIAAWDFPYYSEKLRQERYSYDSEQLRPYFSIDNVIKGAFYTANKLHGVTFKQRRDLPVWDINVRVYEVRDREERFLALYYLDPFPRANKRSGA